MNPMFFGSTREPLFGVYHAPTTRPVREAGVVLCQPVGHEYVRTHRFVLHLAGALAARGYHVMRFDYSGTGDSWGGDDDASLARWVRDTRAAADELRETAGVSRLHLVGIRLGGAIALRAAQGRADVEAVVLWDPVLRGAAYVAELAAVGEAFLASEYPAPRRGERFDPAVHGVVGHVLGSVALAELEELDLTTAAAGRQLALVLTHERGGIASLRRHLEDVRHPTRIERVHARPEWESATQAAAALLPQQFTPVTDAVAACLQ